MDRAEAGHADLGFPDGKLWENLVLAALVEAPAHGRDEHGIEADAIEQVLLQGAELELLLSGRGLSSPTFFCHVGAQSLHRFSRCCTFGKIRKNT